MNDDNPNHNNNDLIDDDLRGIDEAEEFGEESVSGSAPLTSSDDDTSEALGDVIGNEPEPGKPFSLAEEMEKDELDRRGIDKEDLDQFDLDYKSIHSWYNIERHGGCSSGVERLSVEQEVAGAKPVSHPF